MENIIHKQQTELKGKKEKSNVDVECVDNLKRIIIINNNNYYYTLTY